MGLGTAAVENDHLPHPVVPGSARWVGVFHAWTVPFDYGLSSFRDYLRDLAGELHAYPIDAPLRDLATVPLPQPFAFRYERDVARYAAKLRRMAQDYIEAVMELVRIEPRMRIPKIQTSSSLVYPQAPRSR